MSPNAPGIPLFWKLCCRLLTLFVLAVSVYGQDGQTDHSSVHPDSKALEYLLPLFTIHGVPKNEDPDNPVTILVNHGYLIGFSKKYNQPLWAAYQVSKVKRDVDYERFPFFVDDLRLQKIELGRKPSGTVTILDIWSRTPLPIGSTQNCRKWKTSS